MSVGTKNVVELNTENFDEFIKNSQEPVLVDFWAAWCGPCRILGPVLEQVGHKYAGRVKIAKVNVDENPELAMRFGVRGIPVVKGFVSGQQVHETVGAYPREHWEHVVEFELRA